MLADLGKIVVVAALDATFQRKPFRVVELIPVAEKVTKLTAVCRSCSRDAAFTIRLCESLDVELIGGHELYQPACRKCYLEHTNAKDEKHIESTTTTNNSEVSDESIQFETKSEENNVINGSPMKLVDEVIA